jgi:hypothetical protein
MQDHSLVRLFERRAVGINRRLRSAGTENCANADTKPQQSGKHNQQQHCSNAKHGEFLSMSFLNVCIGLLALRVPTIKKTIHQQVKLILAE